MRYANKQLLMERRLAIRYLLIISGGIIIFPSCLNGSGKASIKLRNLDINGDQENLMAEIAETLIPKTDTPGAKELGIHLFVLKMLDDCYEKDVQQRFVKGLEQLDDSTKKRFGNAFVNCTAAQRQKILQSIESKAEYPVEVFDFYQIMKDRTIQGYLNSKYVMTKLVIYELVPGRYNGYFRVKTT
jgi:hypothetical protein